MEKESYNWWNNPENRTTVELPIAIVKDLEYWVAATVEDERWLGKELHSCSQGETKEEAIQGLFDLIRFRVQYADECRFSYQRWVPFRYGSWGKIGGNWFAIFGIHVYFRYGKNMQGGWRIPFTKLNVSTHSDWVSYRNWKLKQQNRAELEP